MKASRWVSLMIVTTMVFSIVGGLVPVTASADPVTMALMYPEYLAGLEAAGLTYGGVTSLDTFRTQTGATAREAVVLQAAAQSYGLAPSVGGVSWGQLAALQAGMLARNTWARVQVAAASAYAYGSYAWASLALWGSSLFAYQAVASGSAIGGQTYTNTGAQAWCANYAAAIAGGAMAESNAADALVIFQAWAAGKLGVGYAGWFSGSGGYYVKVQGGCTFNGVNYPNVFIKASALTGTYGATGYPDNASLANAIRTLTEPEVAPVVDPLPYDPDMPDDPFPGEQGPLPDGPHLQPIPIPWINDPSSSGVNPPGAPADTPVSPVPYVPPATADQTPIPQAGLPPLPGKRAHDAAVALDAAVPDSLAWLKDPFVAILGWLGDFFDWLQGLWNTVCAWVGSWVIPSDAGLASAWTQPWQALQANALSRWPFAMATVTGSLVGALISPGSASQTLGALQLNTTVLGMPLSFDMAPALQSIQGFGWIAQGFAWLWLVVSLFISFRPRVVT